MLDFETIKTFYIRGLWNDQLVKMAAKKGLLTPEEVHEILISKEE